MNFGPKTVLILDVKRAEAVEENGRRGWRMAYQHHGALEKAASDTFLYDDQ